MNEIKDSGTSRLLFFDLVRTVSMSAVVIYHAVAAYSIFTPHWIVHNGHSIIADMMRRLSDVFMMPAFFFVAGHFAVLSLTKYNIWKFLQGKFRRIGIPWLLAIFLVVPLIRYAGDLKAGGRIAQPFGHYWLSYLLNFGSFQIGPLSVGTNEPNAFLVSLASASLLCHICALVLPNGEEATEFRLFSRKQPRLICLHWESVPSGNSSDHTLLFHYRQPDS
jgi:Acyltransferase family